MTRQEYLMDRYEDALFSLMMDKVATQEGEKALLELERLQKEETNSVPDALHRKCLKTIRRYFAQKHAKTARHTVSTVISKIALIALLGVLTFTIAFATSPTFRTNTMNFVMEMFDDHAEFRFEEEPSQLPSITVNWIPDGYTLLERYCDDVFETIIYTNDTNGRFDITSYGAEIEVALDTESATCTVITIDSTIAQLFENTDTHTSQIIWQTDSKNSFIKVSGENIDVSDLINIANNLAIH